MNFKSVLSDKRLPVETPEKWIDDNGKAVFGTFDKEFKSMDIMKVDKQSKYLPNWFNFFRETQWEAMMVQLKDALLLVGVSDMGFSNSAIVVFYDRKLKRATLWRESHVLRYYKIPKNLFNGSEGSHNGKNVNFKITNHMECGEISLTGDTKDKKNGSIKFKFDFERVSKPSIVSIPFGENKPLYTQKDLFKADGYIEVNGKRYETDETSTGILDDHKGYYPFSAHYDWLTSMGKREIDSKEQFFGFNLTRNQSINQNDYNENMVWFEDRTSRLTPVRFDHIDNNNWHVKDLYGMTDIDFEIGDRVLISLNLGVIKVTYYIFFGEIKGYVCDEEGNKYSIDGMCGIAEDKTLKY